MTAPRPVRLLTTFARHPVVTVLLTWGTTQLCLLLSGPLVVRLLGVEQRGELAMVFAILLLCSQFGLVGLPTAIMYFTSSEEAPAWSLVRAVRRPLVVQLVAAAGASMVAVVLVHELSRGLSYPVAETLLVGGGVVVTMLALVVQGGLQGEHRFRALALVVPAPSIVYAGALAVFLAIDISVLPLVLAALLTGWLVSALVGAALLHRTRDAAAPSSRGARDLVRYGRRAAVATAAPTDQLGVDQLLIGAILGHAALGLYVIGMAFESVVLLPLVSLATFVGPRIASISPDLRLRTAARWQLVGGAMALLVCVAVLVSAPTVVPLAFGSHAAAAVPAARVLAVAGVLMGMRRLNAVVLQALGAPGRSARVELLAFVTMVVAVSGLAWSHGVLGATVGVVIAGAVATTAQWATLLRMRRGSPPADFSAHGSRSPTSLPD